MQVVVFALGVGSTVADAAHLVAAFRAICAEHAAVSLQPDAASAGQQHTRAAAVATDSTADASDSNRWANSNSTVGMQSRKLFEEESADKHSNDLRYQSRCQQMTPRDAFFAITER